MWAKIVAVAAIATGLLVPGAAQASGCFTPPCHANYYGGPVMASARTVFVLWGSSTNASFTTNVPIFLGDVAHDSGTTQNVFAVLPEYSTAGLTPTGGAASSNQMLWYSQTYAGATTITPAHCPAAATCTVTEAQIRTELINQINAGMLTAPTGDGLSTAYLVLFPHGVTVQQVSGGLSGQQFCATHGNTAMPSGTKVVYVLLPDESSVSGCGTGTSLQNETSMLSHELREALTDPLIDEVGNTLAPPLAWYDPTNGELDDMCEDVVATNTINGHQWTVQDEWSNKANTCVGTSTYGTPAADFSSNPYEPVTFNGSGSSPNGNKSIAKYSWDFGDGSSGDGATAQHLYAAAGTYHVTLTAYDSLGFLTRVSHDVVALAPPQSQPPPSGTGGGSPPPPATSSTGGGSPAAAGGSAEAVSPGSISAGGAPSTSASGGTDVVAPGITVACNAPVACNGTVVVTARVPAGQAARLKTITLASGRFSLKPGARLKVTFKLTKAGAALLRKLGKLKASVRVTLTYPGATAPVVLTRVTTIKPPRARPVRAAAQGRFRFLRPPAPLTRR